MRRKLVVGNWKMHGSIATVQALLEDLKAGLDGQVSAMDAGVCPTLLHVPLAEQLLAGSAIKLGVQHVNANESGAFTGEVAAKMLTDFGVSYCLVGHSERRELFAETDEDVAAKFLAIQAAGVIPILCVGETLGQREQAQTETVILAQLDAVLSEVGIAAFGRAVVAYEPIWAPTSTIGHHRRWALWKQCSLLPLEDARKACKA